jgi:hypothetical protein
MAELIGTIEKSWSLLPSPIAGVLALAIGLILAVLLRFIVYSFLKLIRFDSFNEKIGVAEFLRKGKSRYSPSKLVAAFVYWIIVLVSLLEVAKILDTDLYKAISQGIIKSVPNAVAGIMIAIVGYLLVAFLANFVLTIALNAAIPNAGILAKAIKWLGAIIVVTIALEEAGLGKSIIEFMFQILLAATGLGLALAFGLGCKDIARRFFEKVVSTLHERERAAKSTDLEG